MPLDLNDDWAALRPCTRPDVVYRVFPSTATDLEDFALIQYNVVGEDTDCWYCRLAHVRLQGNGFQLVPNLHTGGVSGHDPLKLSKSGCNVKLEPALEMFRAHVAACLTAIITSGARARTAVAQAEREATRLEEIRIRMELLSRVQPDTTKDSTRAVTVQEFQDSLDEF